MDDGTRHPAQLSALVRQMTDPVCQLTPVERAVYMHIWLLIARISAPVVARNLNYDPDLVQSLLDKLTRHHLLWFDPDLHAILQCPPFSALHTPHQVKTLGWERTYMCSFLDSPLSLLVYGPNTWVQVETICPRSGERLGFRVMLDQRYRLRLDAPQSAAQWRIWVPLPPNNIYALGLNGDRSKINAFYTQTDFETYMQYAPSEDGIVLTFTQAMELSQTLLQAYQSALIANN